MYNYVRMYVLGSGSALTATRLLSNHKHIYETIWEGDHTSSCTTQQALEQVLYLDRAPHSAQEALVVPEPQHMLATPTGGLVCHISCAGHTYRVHSCICSSGTEEIVVSIRATYLSSSSEYPTNV